MRSNGKSLVKSFDMTPTDERLRDALLAWRHEQALKRFGPFMVNSFGAKIILSDEVLGRLVACAQAFKLSIVPDITRETGWAKEKSWVDDLGDSLLQLIHEYYLFLYLSHYLTSTPPLRQEHHASVAKSSVIVAALLVTTVHISLLVSVPTTDQMNCRCQ